VVGTREDGGMYEQWRESNTAGEGEGEGWNAPMSAGDAAT
jgi:hypothetical protein